MDELQVVNLDLSLLAADLRPASIRMYTRDFEAYITFAGTPTAALDASMLERWRLDLVRQGHSPNTINRMLSAVRSIVKIANRQGYIDPETTQAMIAVPGVKRAVLRERLKRNARTFISETDMRRLCNAPATDTLAGMMHHALFLTLATSGLRISEAVGLKQADISETDNDGRPAYFVSVLGKGHETAEQVPLGVSAYRAIQDWLAVRPLASDYIFTGFGGRGDRDPSTQPILASSAWSLVRHYAKRCGLEHIKPHDFRRYVGTRLAARNPRHAQLVLRHQDLNTTYKHYVLDDLPAGLTDDFA